MCGLATVLILSVVSYGRCAAGRRAGRARKPVARAYIYPQSHPMPMCTEQMMHVLSIIWCALI